MRGDGNSVCQTNCLGGQVVRRPPREWQTRDLLLLLLLLLLLPPPPPPPPSSFLLLLQRSTAMQVRSSVRLMPQNQPSGRRLLPSPAAWSPDQHHAVTLADVSRHILGRTEGHGLEFGQLVRTHTGKCLKCQSSSDGPSDHSAPCAGGR